MALRSSARFSILPLLRGGTPGLLRGGTLPLFRGGTPALLRRGAPSHAPRTASSVGPPPPASRADSPLAPRGDPPPAPRAHPLRSLRRLARVAHVHRRTATSPRRRPPRRWELWLIGALLLIGAAACTAWVLDAVLVTRLQPANAYAGEPSDAPDGPLGGIFRATDLVAGLAVLAGCVIALVRLPAVRRPLPAVGWVLLALFGAATAVDSRLPHGCTPARDQACDAHQSAGLVPAAHSAYTAYTAHGVAGSLAVLCALAGLVILTAAARRYACWSRLARIGPYLAAAELGATIWTLAAVAALQAWHVGWALGAGRRAQVALIAVWLAMLAASVPHVGRAGRHGGTSP